LAGSGGLATGTLNWNTSGVRTSGSGIGITANGIVAFNSSGQSTFVLDGNTGSATFSGTLSAASGSFSGNLTAQTITTGNIVNAAVSDVFSSTTSSTSTSLNVSVPSGASAVLVTLVPGTVRVNDGKGEYEQPAYGTLTVAGSQAAQGMGTISWGISNPPAGTYTISATRSNAFGVGIFIRYQANMFLLVQVLKR
jgi:hypothetical protein